MTTQLIRMIAKEIAGEVYEGDHFSLSERFRTENFDQKAFVAREWIHYVDAARERMVMMLSRQDVTENEKEVIMQELIEHTARSQSANAQYAMQVKLHPREREDVRHVDSNPQLTKVGA